MYFFSHISIIGSDNKYIYERKKTNRKEFSLIKSILLNPINFHNVNAVKSANQKGTGKTSTRALLPVPYIFRL